MAAPSAPTLAAAAAMPAATAVAATAASQRTFPPTKYNSDAAIAAFRESTGGKAGATIPLEGFAIAILMLAAAGGAQLSDSETARFEAAIAAVARIVDRDSNGSLSEAEFVLGGRFIHRTLVERVPPGGDVDLLLELLDVDHSGTVSAAELQRVLTAVAPAHVPAEAVAAIAADIMAAGDHSGDGTLDRDELETVAARIGALF